VENAARQNEQMPNSMKIPHSFIQELNNHRLKAGGLK
jgi:hypothetical protein